MDDNNQTKKIVAEAKGVLVREQAKRLVDEGKLLLKKDLRGGLVKLRQAQAMDPDYPDLEDEIFLREDAVEKLDSLLDYVVVLLKGHKDYQACQMLKELPENYIIEDRAKLVGDLTERIGRVEKLLQEIKSLSKSGNNQALQLYEEAARLVPDYPGLQEELVATRNSFSRYQIYLDSIEAATKALDLGKAGELLKTFREVYPDDANVGKFEVALRNKSREVQIRRNLKKTLLAAGGLIVLVLVLATTYLGYETLAVNSAGNEWQQVSRLLEEKKFAEAQAGGQEIIATLEKVRLLSRARKAELLAKVNQVLSSEMVQQGAAGRVLVDGEYIPAEDLPKVMSAKGLMAEAISLGAGLRHQEAITKYEEALRLASSLDGNLAGRFAGEIRPAIRASREQLVEVMISESLQLNRSSNFEGALARVNEASGLISKYGLQDSGLPGQISSTYQQITLAKFRTMVTAGDKHLGAGRYDEALGAYDRALGFAQSNKLEAGNEGVLARVRETMAVARVNGQVEKADSSFRRSRWREAIIDYSTAIKLHQESGLRQDLPTYTRAVANLAKARRTSALEELRLAEREAQQNFGAGEWEKARAAYVRLVTLVDQGDYGSDQDFARVRGAAESRLGEVGERLLIAGKKDYLMERHRTILKKVFNLGGESAFLDPAVVFLLEDESGMKFSLTARSYERKGTQGKYTFYEAIYAFNRQSEEWVLLDQKISSQVSGGR